MVVLDDARARDDRDETIAPVSTSVPDRGGASEINSAARETISAVERVWPQFAGRVG